MSIVSCFCLKFCMNIRISETNYILSYLRECQRQMEDNHKNKISIPLKLD